MILSGNHIQKEVKAGRIIISPFESNQLNPNSYDFRLGSTLKIYKNETLDTKIYNEVDIIELNKSGFTLEPNKIYLGHTLEKMGSEHYVPIIRGRSSTGRLGLFVHITADLIDLGSINQYTLMMHAVQGLKIYPGMRIGQVTFWEIQGEKTLYSGKYQGSIGPIESKIHKDIAR